MSASNASAGAAEEFLSGKLQQVHVDKIERELYELWHAASTVQEAEHKALARACALNFILLASDASGGIAAQASDLLDQITQHQPCRAILALTAPSRESSLEAWVSARCHMPAPGSTKQICCEQITVRCLAPGLEEDLAELASVVVPLLLPDLPVVLWWHTGVLDQSLLKPLMPYLDRLLIDSAGSTAPLSMLAEICQFMRSNPERPVLSDLSWHRTLPWRSMIARIFDAPESRSVIGSPFAINSVEIASSSDKGHSQAMLVVGWLAGRLGWEVQQARWKDNKIAISWQSAGSPKQVSLVQANMPDHPGDISQIILHGDKAPVHLSLSAGEDDHRAVEARAQGRVLAPSQPAPTADACLICHELESFRRDRIFEEAVVMVSQVVSLL